jgi:signal transduction histidine kinase
MKSPQPAAASSYVGFRAWLPFVFVVGSLVLLLVTPFITSRRVAHIRENVVDLTNEARILVSEFEGAFAEELVIASAGPEGRVGAETGRSRAILRERMTERRLDSAIHQIGGRPVALLGELRAAEAQWRALNPVEGTIVQSEAARDRRSVVGRQVIDAAETLHQQLVNESDQGREAVRRLEQTDLIVTAILASIALVATLIVAMLQRRVRAFAAEADDRARRLERSIELRATLINGVGHDVKNPLGAAAGYADLLEEGVAGPLNDQQAEMVARLKRLIATALQTVSELVELARVNAGELTIDRRETNLVSTIRRIVDDHQAQAEQKSMTLTFNPSDDALWMVTDAGRLRHVIENLLSNALKYAPEGGTIEVGLRVTDEPARSVRIAVRDNGPGVPPELRERIFDPFYRVPSSERQVQGSGLGLAISRRIANLLGGTLSVGDAPGGGAEFVLTLPLEPRGA